MADPDSVPFMGTDAQDLAEVFDETHLDEEGDDFALHEEMTDVFDATRDRQRPLPSRLSPRDPPDSNPREDLEARADTLLAHTLKGLPQEDEEIELVYTGLMRNQRGAQASAAHWEARNLSDEDIHRLGYSPSQH